MMIIITRIPIATYHIKLLVPLVDGAKNENIENGLKSKSKNPAIYFPFLFAKIAVTMNVRAMNAVMISSKGKNGVRKTIAIATISRIIPNIILDIAIILSPFN